MSVLCKVRTLTGRCDSPADAVRSGLRAIYFTLRAKARLDSIVELEDIGIRLFLPAQASGVTRQIYALRGNYELELRWLSKFIRPGDVAFDVGANFGIYTAYLAAAVGSTGRVCAFEPFPPAYSRLQRTAATAGSSNIFAYPFALSSSAGPGEMQECAVDVGSNRVRTRPSGEVNPSCLVEVRTLDEMFRELSLPRVNFIKLDIEGGELEALRGGLHVLRTQRPTILVEMNPEAAAAQGSSTDQVFVLLRDFGYRFATLTAAGELTACLRPPDKLTNMLAMPS